MRRAGHRGYPDAPRPRILERAAPPSPTPPLPAAAVAAAACEASLPSQRGPAQYRYYWSAHPPSSRAQWSRGTDACTLRQRRWRRFSGRGTPLTHLRVPNPDVYELILKLQESVFPLAQLVQRLYPAQPRSGDTDREGKEQTFFRARSPGVSARVKGTDGACAVMIARPCDSARSGNDVATREKSSRARVNWSASIASLASARSRLTPSMSSRVGAGCPRDAAARCLAAAVGRAGWGCRRQPEGQVGVLCERESAGGRRPALFCGFLGL